MSDYIRHWELSQTKWNDSKSNGSFFELRVIQAPKQGRANPPVPSHETKGSGLDNKRQKKDGKNVASDNNPTIVRNRAPLDPPAVIELLMHDDDPKFYYRNCPHIMCAATLYAVNPDGSLSQARLSGTTVSSMHNIKTKPDGNNHAFFVFQDLCPLYPGTYLLSFTVFTIGTEGMKSMQTISCDPFVVTEYKAAAPTLPPATPLTKSLADSGVKLRLRKEPAKRKTGTPDWSAGKLPLGGPLNEEGRRHSNGLLSRGPLPANPSILHNGIMRAPTAGENIEDRVVFEPQGSFSGQQLPLPCSSYSTVQPQFSNIAGPSTYNGPTQVDFNMLQSYVSPVFAQNTASFFSRGSYIHTSQNAMFGDSNAGNNASSSCYEPMSMGNGRKTRENLTMSSNGGYVRTDQDHMIPSIDGYVHRSASFDITHSHPTTTQGGTMTMPDHAMYESAPRGSLSTLDNNSYVVSTHNNMNMTVNNMFPTSIQGNMTTYHSIFPLAAPGNMSVMGNTSYATASGRNDHIAAWEHAPEGDRVTGMI